MFLTVLSYVKKTEKVAIVCENMVRSVNSLLQLLARVSEL